MAGGGLFDKAKDLLGGAVGDLGEKAKDLAEKAADTIDDATEASGGIAKQVGDLTGVPRSRSYRDPRTTSSACGARSARS